MDMPKLVDGCCAAVAVIFKSATQQQLSDKFGGIDLNMTEEEEEELRKEYAWVTEIDKDRYMDVKTLMQMMQDQSKAT